jgi:tRNA/tmRNA/rRNA uracil-C5-methylase (TrmA/RlmC/RlmD family)
MGDAEQPEKRRRRRGAKSRDIAEDGPKQKETSNKRKIEQVDPPSAPAPAPSAAPTPAPAPTIANATKSQVDNGKKNKKQKKKKLKIPKKGEPGYLSPTQLRNARKRRAKQKKQGEVTEENQESGNDATLQKKNFKSNRDDPSLRYIKDPRSAPLVKKAKSFFKGMSIPFEVYVGELSGWRTVSKLPVRRSNDEEKSCVIGLFKPGSHTIVKVPNCVAHHPSINRTIEILQKECDDLGIEPFNEFDGTGILRYVCINVERNTGKVQLTLVWNAPPYSDGDGGNDDAGKELLDTFTKDLVGKSSQLQLHSLWVHFNSQSKHADNVFDYGSSSDNSSLWKHVHGPKHIIETLDLSQCPTPNDVKLHFPPNVFRQANLDAFTKIVLAIRKYVMSYNNQERSETVLPTCLELYGGVGTLGLNICDLLSSFVSSDENPYNKICFEKAAKLLSSKNRAKCTYIPKNATDVIKEAKVLSKDCEILLVDPPRKGLGEYVTQSFIDAAGNENGPKVLIYVSCGFEAFTRDCDQLLKSTKWKLDNAEGHLLFPGSDAIETLAFFRRT